MGVAWLLVKPLLGRTLWRGVCPPSKNGLGPPPDRAFWPLCPRPQVLPRPDPTPLPTRLRFFLAPGLSLMLFKVRNLITEPFSPETDGEVLRDEKCLAKEVTHRECSGVE